MSQPRPPFGLGMAALGRPGYINLSRSNVFDEEGSDLNDAQRRSKEAMRNHANAVMNTMLAVAKEYNFLPWFDCARSYGLSEQFVGDFLRDQGVLPDQVFVSSKWGYSYVADWNIEMPRGDPHEVKDHSLRNFTKQLEETKESLGAYVKLYQVHSATFDSGILTDTQVHEALAQARKDLGWMIGISVSGPKQAEIIRKAMEIRTSDGARLFDSIQCTFNLLEQAPKDALMEAHEQGIDVIIKEGMANGRVLNDPTLIEEANWIGCGADALALAAILAMPFHPRVLSGAVTPEQLRSNAKSLSVSRDLRRECDGGIPVQGLMKHLALDSARYWKDRSTLTWN